MPDYGTLSGLPPLPTALEAFSSLSFVGKLRQANQVTRHRVGDVCSATHKTLAGGMAPNFLSIAF